MKKILFLIPALFVLSFSCKTSQKTSDVSTPANDTITDYSFRKVVQDRTLFASTTEDIILDTVYVSGDTLHILTKKILGCDEENLTLFWNGLMMKSLPPQTSVKLFQRVDPACKEQHWFHLTYNIKPLRMKGEAESENSRGGTTIVRVGGWKGGIKYAF